MVCSSSPEDKRVQTGEIYTYILNWSIKNALKQDFNSNRSQYLTIKGKTPKDCVIDLVSCVS